MQITSKTVLLNALFLLGTLPSFCQLVPAASTYYSIAHLRLGLSTFREVGINFHPFSKHQSGLIAGLGYRFSLAFLEPDNCFLSKHFNEGFALEGPYLMFGYDTKRLPSTRHMNFSFQAGARYLSANNVVDAGDCLVGFDPAESRYDLLANDLFGKIYMDIGGHERKVNLFIGCGFGFRFLTIEYTVKGQVGGISQPSDEVVHDVYGIPIVDAGFRFDIIRKKTGN